MKLGEKYNLNHGNNKIIIEKTINACGVSKSINELAISYHCIDSQGTKFDLVQFHNNRQIIHCMHP